jgi:hypothetical protein
VHPRGTPLVRLAAGGHALPLLLPLIPRQRLGLLQRFGTRQLFRSHAPPGTSSK